jgi:hypothetical protein
VIWHKPNGMPESVRDRPTSAHEHVFLLSKSQHYFYDQDAIREPPADYWRKGGTAESTAGGNTTNGMGSNSLHQMSTAGRNKRNVWTIPTHPFPDSHFATYPPALVELCIKAGTSEWGCCPECGAPWERVTEPSPEYAKYLGKDWADYEQDEEDGRGHFTLPNGDKSHQRPVKRKAPALTAEYITTGFRPTCACRVSTADLYDEYGITNPAFPDEVVPKPVACRVLDPFGGAGTTGLVADRLQRDATLVEIKAEYAEMARARIAEDAPPMFASVEVVR